MTSREALKQYREIYIDKNYNGDIAPSQEWFLDIIEKDLDRLEILKKHYDRNSLSVSLDNFILFYIYKDDNDFKKIKEWLENDK